MGQTTDPPADPPPSEAPQKAFEAALENVLVLHGALFERLARHDREKP